MIKEYFGADRDGKKIYIYTVSNKNGMRISVTDYGARLVSVVVWGKDGRAYDVVLGYDSAGGYIGDPYCFGATIGRNANRTKNAEAQINGMCYQLEKNEGENSCHSGTNGYQKRIWKVGIVSEQKIRFFLDSPDMDQGFPGRLQMAVSYDLTDDNEIVITYEGMSDKDTVINMTHHSYFNLNGHDSGDVMNHEVKLYAEEYSVIDEESVPTGERAKVAGTPMDFTEWKRLGRDINADFEQLALAGDYNHSFFLKTNEKQLAAEVIGEMTGIRMEVYTDLPALQLYAGKYLEKTQGKEHVVYDSRQGVCFEAQYPPNAMNTKEKEMPVFRAGEAYKKYVTYKFYESHTVKKSK